MRRLPLEAAQILPGGPRHQLRRVYTERDLIALGLGTTFGVGVMKYAGLADLLNAGPATIVSCAIAGVVILLCGLCFAELASLVPVAGGAFSYAYIAFGELCAWLVGWAVILELLATIGVLARGVSLYAVRVLTDLRASIPPGLSGGVGQDTGFDLVLLVTIVVLAGA